MEEWKPIVIQKDGVTYDYTGIYEVCNQEGKVRALKYGIIKQHKRKNGYITVQLSKDGNRQLYYVHRLVATAFIPNPEGKPYVNHKDENKHNNSADNLEWVTPKENTNYGTNIQRHSEAMKGEKNPMHGKKHTEETKRKISETKKAKS